MDFIVDKVANYCICNEYIVASQKDWLKYGVEKRLSTLFVLIPFTILALWFLTPLAALSFFSGFFLLKRFTNGYHAKSLCGCLFKSLLCECFFLTIIYHHLNIFSMIGLNFASIATVWFLAPYNHPNMHFTVEEVCTLRKRSRHTIVLLTCVIVFCTIAGVSEIAKGLTTGISMVAFLLCLAYITDWREHI